MVHCEVFRKDLLVASYDAVNDIVVGKGTISRLNHCAVYIDGAFVSVYKADSLIVSTPTGSTAYSLAAGGPILMPSVNAFVVTPVAAHSLTHRPLLVPDTCKIDIVVNTGAGRSLPEHRRSGRHANVRWRPRRLPQVGASGQVAAHQGNIFRCSSSQAEMGTELNMVSFRVSGKFATLILICIVGSKLLAQSKPAADLIITNAKVGP